VSLRAGLLVTAVAVMASACITAPSPDLPVPPIVQVDSVDVRAQQFGNNTREIVTNPVLDSKIHALFGPDWTLAPAARLRAPASSFFATGSPPRMLRTQEAEYVAVTGCGPAGCGLQSVLLLVRPDAEVLLARLDEGGFSHYYGYGTGLTMSPATRALLDRARTAVEKPA
jgi:hypothetical protein